MVIERKKKKGVKTEIVVTKKLIEETLLGYIFTYIGYSFLSNFV